MLHTSVENQLTALDARVHALEKKRRSGAALPTFHVGQKYFLRLLGVFVVLCSGLALLALWRVGASTNMLLLLWLMVGVWLILRDSSVFGISESTRILLQESRSRKAQHARGVHAPHTVRKAPAGQEIISLWRTILLSLAVIVFSTAFYWLIMVTVADPAWQLFAFLVTLIGVVAYSFYCRSQFLFFLAAAGMYVLCASSSTAFFAMLAVIAISTGLLAYGWAYRLWSLLYVVLIGSYVSVAVLLTATTVDPITRTLALLWPTCLSVLVLMPATYVRRTAEERQSVRGLFTVSGMLVGLFICSFIATSSVMAAEVLGLLIILLSGQYALSWQAFGRSSYAKYFAFYCLALLGVVAFLLLSFPYLVLATFMLGIVLLTSSFTVQSYSTRLAGVLLTVESVASYLLFILPLRDDTLGPWLLRPAVWLGILMSCFLLLLCHWFRHLHLTGAEKRQERQLVGILSASSIILLYTVLYYTVLPPWQTMGWLLISICALPYAMSRKLSGMQLLASAAGILSFFKLFLIDSLTFAPVERLFSLIILGVLLVCGAYILAHYQQSLARLLKISALSK